MFVGPDNVLLTIDARFSPTSSAAEVVGAIDSIEDRIQARFPNFNRMYIEAETRHSATAAVRA